MDDFPYLNRDKWAVYNPHDLPVDRLPKIFGFCNGGSPGFFNGVIITEDGSFIGGHCSSDEFWLELDLGMVEGAGFHKARHKKDFVKHYPEGYRTEFVAYNDVPDHSELQAAFKEADKKQEKAHD